MNSARITFEKKQQTIQGGRKVETWATVYVAWANLPALSVREQTDVHNRSLTDAITLEIRNCAMIQEIVDDLKQYRAIHKGKVYNLDSADPSRGHEGMVRILVSRMD